jgi:putative spermidine/putrescine transport system substrate-binding protein
VPQVIFRQSLRPGNRRLRAISVAVVAVAAIIAGGAVSPASALSQPSPASPGEPVNAATPTSVAAFGGMSGLIAAAKKEGRLNVITLPSDWANYGTTMRDFSKKYGINITDANPDGSSQDELNAVADLKGTSREPDVVDLAGTFAVTGRRRASGPPTRWRPGARSPPRPRRPTVTTTPATAATRPSATARPR